MHVLTTLRMGGTELGVVRLSNGLPSTAVTTSICSSWPADDLKHALAPGVRLFEFDRRHGQDPVFVLRLAALMRRQRPDIVHTHSWGTLLEGVVAARLAGVRTVVHGEHGTMETRPLNLMLQRRVWQRVTRVLSVSSRLAATMAERVGYPLERILVIRNGIDTERFHPSLRQAARGRLGLSDADIVISTAGRLVPVKDQATLLRALALVRDRGADVRALIAGDGPLREELTALCSQLGLDERVRFLGARKDVEHVFAASDVFVLSSTSEGLSNTILEAMASGAAVVATRVGGADELVEQDVTGLLVPASAPEAMADALVKLIRDSRTRSAMGAAGRHRASEQFSLARMVAAYESLYRELAGSRPGKRRGMPVEGVCVA
jgi:sugar transferase (PEP-CTERM/EpsH1 system associated)